MRRFSRRMPPVPLPKAVPTWARFVLYVLGAVVLAVALRTYVRYPATVLVALVAIVGYITVDFIRRRHLAREGEARRNEDIGTFARAFDRHSAEFDPSVIRATWDAIVPLTEYKPGRQFALRPTDELSKVFGMALSEDVEDLINEIASRSGRSLDDPSGNPYTGHVRTVGDIVNFVSHQPRRPAA